MALISKIRQNSWLLIVVIGLALAAFILMDMTAGQGRQQAGDFTMGTVNGQAIDYKEFQNTEQILYSGGGNTYANRNQLWNFFVEKALIEQYAEQLGLGVSRDELIELQFGNRLSPIVRQRFVDQNTGQVNRQTLNNMRNAIEQDQLDPQQRAYWAVQEKEIIAARTQEKMNAMVQKAIYTPGWMAEIRNNEQRATADIDFVKIPYAEVEDSQVTVTEDDLKAYIQENKAKFMQTEETRVAEYVVFDIFPTKEDSTNIYNRMVELKSRLETVEDDSTFVVNQNGIYNVTYAKVDEVSEVLKETIMDLEVGTTYGPFIDQGQYQVIKVIDNKEIPDSVQARHILRPVQTQEEFLAANALVDSLIEVIENGSTTFAAAAERFGTDGTRTKGGDLGFAAPGQMVKPFNDMIFYQAEIGELRKVGTRFGLHLIEVTDKKFETNERGVQFSVLFENIVPSQETQTAEYDRVFDIISQNNSLEELRAAMPALGKQLSSTGPLKRNDFTFPEIGAGNTARDIIRWMYTPGIKVGETSPDVYVFKDPVLYFNSKLVLAGLSSINSGDLPSVASVKARIEPLVMNQKKAEVIQERVGGMDMNAAAAAYNVEVQQAEGVNISSGFIPGMGTEPLVIGKVMNLDQGGTAGPIEGADGVYFVKVTIKTPATPMADMGASKRIYASIARNQVPTKLWEAIQEENDIEDNRYTYF